MKPFPTPGRWYSTRMDLFYSGQMILYQDGSYLLWADDIVPGWILFTPCRRYFNPPPSLLKEESTVYAQFIIYLPARLTARFTILELTLSCKDNFFYIVIEILKKCKLTFNELKRLYNNCKSSFKWPFMLRLQCLIHNGSILKCFKPKKNIINLHY